MNNEMPRRKALGKGLEELFGVEVLEIEDQITKGNYDKDEVLEIELDSLRPNPYQPRKNFDEDSLNELANSIKENGVFQPILVKKSIRGYEIIAGERRVRASRLAGKKTIPALVREFDDSKMMKIALLENLQRDNLNDLEEAQAYVEIMKLENIKEGQLSEIIGKSVPYISNKIGLLKLPDEVKDMLINGDINMTVARSLSKFSNPNQIIELAHRAKDEGLTSKQIEEEAQNVIYTKTNRDNTKEKKLTGEKLEYKYIEDSLREKYDTKIRIFKNRLEFTFTDKNDLNRIFELLNRLEK